MEQINTFSARTPALSLRGASLKCHDQGWEVMEQSYVIHYPQGSAPSHLVLSLPPNSPPVGTGPAGATPSLCKYISQDKVSLPGVLFHQQTCSDHPGQRGAAHNTPSPDPFSQSPLSNWGDEQMTKSGPSALMSVHAGCTLGLQRRAGHVCYSGDRFLEEAGIECRGGKAKGGWGGGFLGRSNRVGITLTYPMWQ